MNYIFVSNFNSFESIQKISGRNSRLWHEQYCWTVFELVACSILFVYFYARCFRDSYQPLFICGVFSCFASIWNGNFIFQVCYKEQGSGGRIFYVINLSLFYFFIICITDYSIQGQNCGFHKLFRTSGIYFMAGINIGNRCIFIYSVCKTQTQ